MVELLRQITNMSFCTVYV